MQTAWVLHTAGDAVAAVQGFLGRLWTQAGLQAMFLPLRPAGTWDVERALVTDRRLLSQVDPFAPVLTHNAGCRVAELADQTAAGPFAAVLRPCELRAFRTVAARRGPLGRPPITVGVDCLCTFTPADYQRRARELGGPDEMTHEALLFARQGGVAPYRYRAACQMCDRPIPEDADLTIGVLGLSAGQTVLIAARDPQTSDRLRLDEITDGRAAPAMVARREQLQAILAERHRRVRERTLSALSGVPLTVEALAAHLKACEPCRACLDACPVYAGELTDPARSLGSWLEACIGCGMCEQACPRAMPLAAIIGHISRQSAAAPPGGAAAETTLCWA